MELILQWDMRVLEAAANWHHPILDAVLGLFTTLGNSGVIWIAVAIVLLCTKRYRKEGLALSLALLLCLLFGNLLLKNVIARMRPFLANPEIRLLISPPSGYSFPSGHTYSSFAAAFVLHRTDRRFSVPAFLAAALIGFSRIYFQVHYLTDVLAGVLLGLAIGWISSRILLQKR